ncbi:hypothetical protein [Kribbella monticola]|uniref:hypothetical protein n=1 Tax=Kribbella monticola TaxID=2185285 RepID=UPI001E372AE8|nr:hypothetical protein [Kribbella monticola]
MSSAAVGVVALALALSACSSSPESAPSQSPTGTTTSTPGATQSPTEPPTPGSTPSTPGSSGKPGGPPTWTKLLKQPVDGQHVVTALPKYLVTRGSDEAGTTTITDRANRRVVVRHVPPAGFVAQSPVVIDERWALIEEIRSDGPSPEIRAYRYDLTSGARTDLAKQRALPRISEPEIGAYDGVFAYSSTDSSNRSCLIVAELASLKSRSVTCVADPGYVADPVVSADSVTFSQITAPSTPQRCKRLFTAALSGGPARPIAAAKNCIQWSGASLRGATIWSEVGAADPDQYQSKAYLRTGADSPTQSLGQIVTGTIVACGNWIHWEVRTVTNGAESFQLQRWQPGIIRPQRIYATPPDTALTAPTCQHNTLILEAAHLGAGAKYTEALQVTTA